ncbi:MAG: hypothetical protein ACKO96_05580, partial [Flammeovirgaceae bacterium]
PDTNVGAHIYQHLWGLVVRNPTFTKDGIPCRPFVHFWGNCIEYLCKDDLYIDKGILCKAPGPPKAKEAEEIFVYQGDESTFAVKDRKGVWFLFKYSNRMKKEIRWEETFSHWNTSVEPKEAVYIKAPFTYFVPYYKKISFKAFAFPYYPKQHFVKHGKQYWYLIEIRAMSKKEKKEWGIE